jgi:hypothetical protein
MQERGDGNGRRSTREAIDGRYRKKKDDGDLQT